jgi:hypothetical protein
LPVENQEELELKSMDIIKSFRISEPIFLFLILWILLYLLFDFSRRFSLTQKLLSRPQFLAKLKALGTISAIAIVASYLALAIAYIASNTFFDHAEANIAAVSWLFKTGHSLFPPLDSPERYINNYGPILYIINGFFLTLFGPSFLSVKLGCGLAAISNVTCIFYTATKTSTRQIALIVCTYAVLAGLSITNSFAFHAASFWLRPDPLLMFFVSVGLLGVLRGNRAIAILVAAIAFGCSLNLKVNAFVNFLPIYVLLFQRFGLGSTLLACLGGAVTAALPFLVFPQISFENFAIWLSQSRHKPFDWEQLFNVTKWVFYVSLPLILSLTYLFYQSRASFQGFMRANRKFLYTLLACVIASLAFSIKIGVLENNHLPFIPLFAYLLALVLEWIRVERVNFPSERSVKRIEICFVSAAVAIAVAMLLAIAPEAGRLASTLIKSPSDRVIGDINGIIKAHPNSTIAMGFSQGSGNYELTYYRPLLVFAGNPYPVDAVVMFEMQVSGVDTVSAGTIHALETCQTKLWLFPKVTQQPFDLKNFYPPHDMVFNKEFRRTFLQYYQQIEGSEFFELWACKDDKKIPT